MKDHGDAAHLGDAVVFRRLYREHDISLGQQVVGGSDRGCVLVEIVGHRGIDAGASFDAHLGPEGLELLRNFWRQCDASFVRCGFAQRGNHDGHARPHSFRR